MNKRKMMILLLTFMSSVIFPSKISIGLIHQNPLEIAIIFSTGGIQNNPMNNAVWNAKLQAEETYKEQIQFDWVEPQIVTEFPTYQDDIGKQDKYELIICVGFLQTNALNISAVTYPNQNWVLIDDLLNISNVHSITFKEHEGSFLVGAMAAMTTKTNKLGFFGGLDIYLINKFRYGYEQGTHYINPEIRVTSTYSPDPTNPWEDIPGGKSIGHTFFAAGNDIVYTAAGNTGIGVMQAANETEGVYVIGVDSDQDHLAKGKILCSMVKKYEVAVLSTIESVMDGTFEAGHVQLGINEKGVDISPMIYTQHIAGGNFTLNGITKTRWDWIEWLKAQISLKAIIVGETGSFATTTSVIPNNTSSNASESRTHPDSGPTINISPSWPFLLIIAIYICIAQYKKFFVKRIQE